jgi:Rieske Fe-S protein
VDTDLKPAELTRRNILRSAALGTVAVPVLAACGDDGGEASGGSSPTASDSPSETPSATETPTGGGGDVLAETSEVEVGGAVFLDKDNVVITQPAAGEFHAFDRTCTHQQCPVTDIQDGKIHCSCHGSLYDMATGENVGGPAPAPLTKVDITVQGTEIVKA